MIRFAAFVLVVTLVSCELPKGKMVDLRADGDAVAVFIDREHFVTYHKGGGARTKPYFYPVFSEGGKSMTRTYPLDPAAAGEESDHPHHTGIWFAHGDINGVDFWHGPGSGHPKGGRIVEESMLLYSGIVGWIETNNRYEDESGKTICKEIRRMGFFANEHGRFLDFDVTILATDGKVTMGDTKEGIMAIRLPATLRLKGEVAQGAAIISSGVKGAKGWGTRGKWADFHGNVDGDVVGVAIFDHPENPVHPTRWLIRDYGLFGANPFGLHHFEGKPAGTGSVEIPPGGSMRFRYRFFFHAGDADQARIAEHYELFATEKSGWR